MIDNLPATDTSGYAGLEDEVDYHTWTLLKGIALSTLLGVGSQVAFGSQQSNLVEAIRESTQESTNQAGQRIVEKDLNVQPTITVRPGWPLQVIVHKEVVLQPYRAEDQSMHDLKLSKLPDRSPVKITITVTPDLNRALQACQALP